MINRFQPKDLNVHAIGRDVRVAHKYHGTLITTNKLSPSEARTAANHKLAKMKSKEAR